MKITAILLLAAALQVSASGFGQSITLTLKNASLEKALTEIEKQSGYSFVYVKEQLEQGKTIDLAVQNEKLESVLALVFKDQPLTYTISGKYIALRQKVPTSPTSESVKVETILPIDVHGRIVNENGEPVVGASIKIKGTNIGSSTNEKGEFTLNVPDPNMVLIISALNIETIEIKVNARRDLGNIIVKTFVKALDAIVINKGYYSTSQRLNTGSVVRVSSEEITKQPVSNPIATLHGRVPGLFITQGNGLPGSNFSVLIRGRNSIQNGTAPLFVIDGIPFLSTSDKLTQRINLNANSPFNSINPDDIESIEILKDADATAIYGSRGANGVILITTKKAKAVKSTVDININTGWGKVTRTRKFMNTSQYLQMRREAFANDGMIPDATTAPDLLLWDTTRNINWKDVLLGGTANTFDANLRYSGGNANTKFTLGTNYYSETTVFPGDFGNKRYTASLSVTNQSVNKRLQTTINASYGSDESEFSQENPGQYLNLPPHAMKLYDSIGRPDWTEGASYFGNPIAKLNATSKGVTDRFSTSGIFNWAFNKELSFSITGGFNKITFDEVSLTPISSQDPSNNPRGSASFGNTSIRSWSIEPQINFKKEVGKRGQIQMLAGMSKQESRTENSLIVGTNYTNDALLQSTTGAGTLTPTNGKSEYKYLAFFARLNFNWDNKYLINLTGRRDGSSRFGPDKRFANFGAVGIGWIFSEEHFLKNTKSFLSYGKLRGSVGVTGNDQIGNYQYLDTWSGTQFPYQGIPGFRPTRLFNPDYSWEQIRKLEFALDLGFINDRIILNVNWFRNKSENQIIRYNLPDQVGFNNILRNFPGVVENKGWEIQITTTNIKTKHFEWTSSANITLSKNRLVSFPGLSGTTYASSYIIGKPLNIYIGYKSFGVDPQTGLYKFEDKSGNGQIDYDNQDYDYSGTTDPKYYGGIQNTFRYKNFDLDILFDFRKQMGLEPVINSSLMIGTLINQPTYVLNRWQKPGDKAKYQKFSQDFTLPTYEATYFQSLSDAVLTDASYIRCRTVSLGYTFKVKLFKNEFPKNCRAYLQAQNLFTITNYVGADPENQSTVGVPPLRMIVTGIKLTL